MPTTHHGGAAINKHDIAAAGNAVVNAFDDWSDAPHGSPDERDAAVRLLAAIHRYHPELDDRPDPTGELPGDRELPDIDVVTDRQFLRDLARHHVAHSDGAIRENARLYLDAAGYWR